MNKDSQVKFILFLIFVCLIFCGYLIETILVGPSKKTSTDEDITTKKFTAEVITSEKITGEEITTEKINRATLSEKTSERTADPKTEIETSPTSDRSIEVELTYEDIDALDRANYLTTVDNFSEKSLTETLLQEGYSESAADYAVRNVDASFEEMADNILQEYQGIFLLDWGEAIDILMGEGFSYDTAIAVLDLNDYFSENDEAEDEFEYDEEYEY